MAQPWDYIAKLVVIGDSGTGKSSLTIRLCEDRFVQQHDVTIGVEFGSRVVPVGPPASDVLRNATDSHIYKHGTSPQPSDVDDRDQKRMKLSLWDTAGQETYKSITKSYFRGASGALLVFDISRRKTFDAATGWLNDLRLTAEESIVVILVGNKSDLAASSLIMDGRQLPNNRQVTTAEAEDWCRRNNVFRYVETSAKNGDGVERAFLEVAERIYENIEAGRYDLNDRRSGVKGPGAGGGRNAQRGAVSLNNSSNSAAKTEGWGKCC